MSRSFLPFVVAPYPLKILLCFLCLSVITPSRIGVGPSLTNPPAPCDCPPAERAGAPPPSPPLRPSPRAAKPRQAVITTAAVFDFILFRVLDEVIIASSVLAGAVVARS